MKVNLLCKTQQSSQSRLRPGCIHSFQLPLESCIRHFNHTLHCHHMCLFHQGKWLVWASWQFMSQTKTLYHLGKQNHKDLNRVTSKYKSWLRYLVGVYDKTGWAGCGHPPPLPPQVPVDYSPPIPQCTVLLWMASTHTSPEMELHTICRTNFKHASFIQQVDKTLVYVVTYPSL
jgi:hypothetical protein